MKTDRSANRVTGDDIPVTGNAWTRFWFTPIAPIGLHTLRVLAGLLFICWLLAFAGNERAFFSLSGWFDRQAYLEAQRQPNITPAPLGWSILYLAGTNADQFEAMYWGSLVVLALFTLGVATRLTSIATWVVVVSFMASPATSYDGDYLLGILAFYLMIGYVFLGEWSGTLLPLERVIGSRHDFLFSPWLFKQSTGPRPLSYAANLALRLLQIHVALVLVTSGLHKLQMAEWWGGVAYWYPLHPPFQTTIDSVMAERHKAAEILFTLSLTQYIALAWQIGFPLFAWRSGYWRAVLLMGALAYWLGVMLVFKLPLIGEFVFLGCLSFLGPDEWAWLYRRLGSLAGSSEAPVPRPEPAKAPAFAGKEHVKQ